MYEYLVALSGTTMRTQVQALMFDVDQMTPVIDGAPDEELEALWRGGTGLCTSWTIAAAAADGDINHQYIFGDRSDHRCCFDSENGIIS